MRTGGEVCYLRIHCVCVCVCQLAICDTRMNRCRWTVMRLMTQRHRTNSPTVCDVYFIQLLLRRRRLSCTLYSHVLHSYMYSARGRHEDATRKTVPWNISFTQLTAYRVRRYLQGGKLLRPSLGRAADWMLLLQCIYKVDSFSAR